MRTTTDAAWLWVTVLLVSLLAAGCAAPTARQLLAVEIVQQSAVTTEVAAMARAGVLKPYDSAVLWTEQAVVLRKWAAALCDGPDETDSLKRYIQMRASFYRPMRPAAQGD